MITYSLVIPIYNEGHTLIKLLAELDNLDKKIEIIIINDGSSDKTKSILDNHNNFIKIHNEINHGKGYSIIRGVKEASGENIILMDGDLEIDLNCVPFFIKKHNSLRNHVIVGSRWNEKGKVDNSINTYGNYIINYFFNFLFKTNLNDVLCCVKVIDKKTFRLMNLISNGFSIEMEIMSKLAIANTKFYEIDVSYKRRSNSEGKKLKISDAWSVIFKMLTVKFKK